ncbi:hypothetical protein NDU88_003361 [Pleurodeles waltl]|uniref:Uncharacterized protein n=1 Tax=Pleurodeles waltl TaxID=8319 RepID=A0AAV7VFJ9_PLEWA|nr:hypothetical protein NDU88_003361 [Pleurodeles waltl]
MPCSASHYSGSLSRLPPPSPPQPLLPLSCYVLRCLAQLRNLLALLVDPLHHRLLTHCRCRRRAACSDVLLSLALFTLFWLSQSTTSTIASSPIAKQILYGPGYAVLQLTGSPSCLQPEHRLSHGA